MATKDHARIAPSSLYRTVECNGWIQLAETLPPEPETPEAAEGTAGHEVALAAVDGLPRALGSRVENGCIVTQEMLDGAELWASIVPEGAICETKLAHISRIHPTDCFGTPDAWRYYPEKNRLWVGEYKFGHGYVEEFENWQAGIAYTTGIIEFLGISDAVNVDFDLAQPRYYGAPAVRRWSFSALDIRAHVNIAASAARKALGPNPTTKVGEHCWHCPVGAACKTLQDAGSQAIAFAGSAQIHHTEGPALALELMLLEQAETLIQSRKTGLEEQAKAMLQKGESIPGVSLERGQSRLSWNEDVPLETVATTGDLLGIELRQPSKLITPTQAKAKGLAAGILDAYASRPPGALKLKLDPDNISTRKLFGANTQ